MSGRTGVAAFELANAGVGAAKRLVLDQDGLHQRVKRVGRAPRALADQRLGLRIALAAFKRRQTIEQLGDKLTFLRCHR